MLKTTQKNKLDDASKLLKSSDTYLQAGYYYDFCKNVLQRDLEEQPHREMCDVAEYAFSMFEKYYPTKTTPPEEVKNYFLNMTPRDSYKSTVFTECFTVKAITKYPNCRVLISSEVVGKAKAFSGAAQNHLEENLIYRSLYGDKFPEKKDDETWSKGKWTVRDRTVVGLKEESVMTTGVGGSLPGMHYDIIVADDLVSDKNTQTREQIEKVIEHIALLQSLLQPWGILVIVGTRWHINDAYGDIIDTPEKAEEFNIFIRGACTVDLDFSKRMTSPEERAGLYFPTKLTKSFLKKKLKLQKRFIYNCQYFNEPISEEDQTFDWRKYNLMSENDFERDVLFIDKKTGKAKGNFYWFYLVDPALTDEKKKKGDYTAMSPYIITPDDKIYLYKALAVREGEDTIAETIYMHHMRLCKKLGNPYASYFEMIGFQKLLVKLMKRLEKKFKHKIYWQNQKTENKTSKEIRIRSAVPYVEDGDMFIVDPVRNPVYSLMTKTNKMLIDQATSFPMCKNDDLLDNQGYIIDLKVEPRDTKTVNKRLDFDNDYDDDDGPDDNDLTNLDRFLPEN